ncbi:MAG: SAM-dependent methyltransferase [Saprospiraceae bacterium]|nr:SAM-dependent methyltransferase [Saprospiraceae bacterium]
MDSKLNPEYWNARYQKQDIPWDMGSPSPSLVYLADTYIPKDARILIPGAGLAHEANYLHQNGYTQIFVCDWAAAAIQAVREFIPGIPDSNLLHSDFFELEMEFDFMLEQTFFCAIDRGLREAYVKKVHSLLAPGGQIGGLLFGVEMPGEGPPFGGSKSEYEKLFTPYFDIRLMEVSAYSIKPRAGSELLFLMTKNT